MYVCRCMYVCIACYTLTYTIYYRAEVLPPFNLMTSYIIQGQDLLIVTVFVKEIDKESLQVLFHSKSFSLKFQTT